MRRSNFGFSAALAAGVLLMFGCNSDGSLGCQPQCDHTKVLPAPGACAVPGVPPGSSGGVCYGDGHVTSCDPGLTCIDDVCIACGGPGLVCCEGADRQLSCPSGGTCAYDFTAHASMCQGCGDHVGGACCSDGQCNPAIGTCSGATNTCIAGTGGVCAGSQTFSFWSIDPAGCAFGPLSVFSGNATDAATCASQLVNPGWTAGPLGQDPQLIQDVCAQCSTNGNFPMTLAAFSSAAMDSCKQEQHPSPGCFYTAGACP
jgi:hypothetical protein